jgi:ribosome recycling factor
MAIKEEIAQVRKRMEKAIEDIRKELASIRTGRHRYPSWITFRSITTEFPLPSTRSRSLATRADVDHRAAVRCLARWTGR